MGRVPCCSKVGLRRGQWTPREDRLLTKYIEANGEGKWRSLSKNAGLLRSGKSCRLRWLNYLRPDIKRGNISTDEEDLIIRMHALLGNRWSLIAGRLPGRTDNEIKNYWNTCLGKKLRSQGIDPSTHKKLSNPQQQQHNSDSKKKKRSTKEKIIKPPPTITQTKTRKNRKKHKIDHLPKPVRLSPRNQSFDCKTFSFCSSSQEVSASTDFVIGDTNNLPWNINKYEVNNLLVGENVDHHLVNCSDVACQSPLATTNHDNNNNNNFEKLFEEYLQLLKTDDHGHVPLYNLYSFEDEIP